MACVALIRYRPHMLDIVALGVPVDSYSVRAPRTPRFSTHSSFAAVALYTPVKPDLITANVVDTKTLLCCSRPPSTAPNRGVTYPRRREVSDIVHTVAKKFPRLLEIAIGIPGNLTSKRKSTRLPGKACEDY